MFVRTIYESLVDFREDDDDLAFLLIEDSIVIEYLLVELVEGQSTAVVAIQRREGYRPA